MSQGRTGRGEEGDFDVDFTTDEVAGLEAYTYADRVKERLAEIGLGENMERPRLTEDHDGIFPGLQAGDYFNGRLPVVIRRLTLDQLSALYTMFTSWYSYLTFMTNLIAVERSEAMRQKEFIWSHVRRQKKMDPDTGKKRSDQLMSDAARIDSRFVGANALYEELNVLYNCMQAQLEVTEQDMKVISREVTIVQAKLEKEAMGAGFGRRMNSQNWGGTDGETHTQAPEEHKPKRLKVHRGTVGK